MTKLLLVLALFSMTPKEKQPIHIEYSQYSIKMNGVWDDQQLLASYSNITCDRLQGTCLEIISSALITGQELNIINKLNVYYMERWGAYSVFKRKIEKCIISLIVDLKAQKLYKDFNNCNGKRSAELYKTSAFIMAK